MEGWNDREIERASEELEGQRNKRKGMIQAAKRGRDEVIDGRGMERWNDKKNRKHK